MVLGSFCRGLMVVCGSKKNENFLNNENFLLENKNFTHALLPCKKLLKVSNIWLTHVQKNFLISLEKSYASKTMYSPGDAFLEFVHEKKCAAQSNMWFP